MTRSDHDDFDGLAVGWALHALEPGEEHAFVEHLATCDRCQVTVLESEEVLGELSYDVPMVDPPPELLDRIQAAAGATSPRVTIPSVAEPVVEPVAPTPLARRSRVPRWAPMALAAAVVLIALLSWNVVLRNQATDAQRLAAQRQDVISKMAGSSTRATLLDKANHPIGYVQQRGSDIQVVANGLPANDRTKSTYVLWAVQGAGRPPLAVGTFDVVRAGIDVRRVDGQVPAAGISGFAVSREAGRVAPARPSQVVATGATIATEPN